MLKFSNEIPKICVNNKGHLIIHDALREQVIIVDQCSPSKKLQYSRFYVLKVTDVLSIASVSDGDIILLKKDSSVYTLSIIHYQLPVKNKSKGTCFSFKHHVTSRIGLFEISPIKSLFSLPYKNMVGFISTDRSLAIIYF